MPNIKRIEVEDERHTIDGLCNIARKLGYTGNSNESVIAYFFEDNPGAIEAVLEWVADNYATDEDEDEACPGCGCLPGEGVTEDCDDEDGCGHYKSIVSGTVEKMENE